MYRSLRNGAVTSPMFCYGLRSRFHPVMLPLATLVTPGHVVHIESHLIRQICLFWQNIELIVGVVAFGSSVVDYHRLGFFLLNNRDNTSSR
jgi:hypothetical protein